MALFKLKYDTEDPLSQKGGPEAVPASEGGIIDVVGKYSWTLSPKSARADVPYIEMIERRLTNDVILQQLMYYIRAGAELPVNTLDSVLSAVDYNSISADGTSDDATNNRGEFEGFMEKTIDAVVGDNPYSGLYSMEDTQWVYFFPFFTEEKHNLKNDWGSLDKKSKGLSEFTRGFGEALGTYSSTINSIISGMGGFTDIPITSQPGTYIEQAKQYEFKASGPEYKVEFNLYNTGTISDVIRNWQLCFLLIYQNLPNRRSKAIFDPPPLYEITIPGVRYSPASFIKSLGVKFLGGTRLMDLNLGKIVGGSDDGIFNSDGKIRTIVPDAYQVTIEIEDIFPESKNFLMDTLNDVSRTTISVADNERERRVDISNTVRDVGGRFDSVNNNITILDL